MKRNFIIDQNQYVLGRDKQGNIHYIKEVQDVVFPIILEIDRICRKNNIPYALGFGSCLGLYNYQGFIPWDDDADIVFNYEDLPRLVEALKKDLDDKFVFDCYEVDERYNILQPTIKIKNKYGPAMVDYNYKRMPDHIKSSNGFFVDMVALVDVPNLKTLKKLVNRSRRRLISYFVKDYIFKKDPLKLKAKMKEEEKKYALEFKGSDYVTQTFILPFPSPKHNFFPKEIIYPFKEYDFNGHKLFSFNNLEAFITLFFGKKSLKRFDGEKYVDDFPTKKRKALHVKSFDFGNK